MATGDDVTRNILKSFGEDEISKATKLPEGSRRKFGSSWYIKQGGKWVYDKKKRKKMPSKDEIKANREKLGSALADNVNDYEGTNFMSEASVRDTVSIAGFNIDNPHTKQWVDTEMESHGWTPDGKGNYKKGGSTSRPTQKPTPKPVVSSREARFSAFTKELADLSKKHGVVLSAVGGVGILDDPAEIKSLSYVDDPTSGDLDVRAEYHERLEDVNINDLLEDSMLRPGTRNWNWENVVTFIRGNKNLAERPNIYGETSWFADHLIDDGVDPSNFKDKRELNAGFLDFIRAENRRRGGEY